MHLYATFLLGLAAAALLLVAVGRTFVDTRDGCNFSVSFRNQRLSKIVTVALQAT
jgi:hypothetical protein